jgi:hypothetical protein
MPVTPEGWPERLRPIERLVVAPRASAQGHEKAHEKRNEAAQRECGDG